MANRFARSSLLITLGIFLCLVELLAGARSARAMTIGIEDRLTIARFRELHHYSDDEMAILLSGTVRVICPWGFGTGAIVDRQDTLVTAAHLFFDAKGKPRGSITRCRAVSLKGGRRHKLKVETVVHGFRERPDLLWNDWFVATLQEPMKDAKPYPIKDGPIGGAVIFLAQGQVGWPGHSATTPSVAQCELIESAGETSLLFSNCDFGSGASGGPLLEERYGPMTAPPRILGVGTRWYWPTGAKEKCFVRIGVEDHCYSQFTAIRGELLDAIRGDRKPASAGTSRAILPKELQGTLHLDLVKAVDTGTYCKLTYELWNLSKEKVDDVMFSITYRDRDRQPKRSQVARFSALAPGDKVPFELRWGRCRKIRSVIVDSVMTLLPAAKGLPSDVLVRAFKVTSRVKGISGK